MQGVKQVPPNTTPRTLYNVTRIELGDPGATPEIVNDAPLGLYDAITLAAETVTEMQDANWILDGLPSIKRTTRGSRQWWELHNGSLRAVVEVVEAQAVTS